jgi:hypothetical protein
VTREGCLLFLNPGTALEIYFEVDQIVGGIYSSSDQGLLMTAS